MSVRVCVFKSLIVHDTTTSQAFEPACVLKPKDPDCNSSLIAAGISLLAPRGKADLDLVKYCTCRLPRRRAN